MLMSNIWVILMDKRHKNPILIKEKHLMGIAYAFFTVIIFEPNAIFYNQNNNEVGVLLKYYEMTFQNAFCKWYSHV